MDKKVRGDNKKTQKNGDTFYEAISATAVAPHEVSLPRVSVKTADFLESVIIFFAGTVLVLLLMRVVLMMFGISGGNLLTYLLYAVSYPFVLILNSGQGQVPSLSNNILYENIAIIVIYSIVFYGTLRIVRAVKAEDIH
jgi:hypothetical protein